MAANCWIFFLVAVSAAGQIAPDQKTSATLEGRVIHSATSEAIRKAHVTLESTAEGNDSELVATTDDSGHFRFANVTPGVYRLTAEKHAFIGGGYGQIKPKDDLTLLKVNNGDQLHDLTLRLFPAGAISGRVLDADGDPIAGQQVTIFWAKAVGGGEVGTSHAGDATTNETGEYRVDGLSEGNYYVSADPDPEGDAVREIPVDSAGKVTNVRELVTFFPAALTIADAESIHIEGGQEKWGIDIRIRRAPMLSVKGRIAGMTSSVPRYELSADVPAGFGWTSKQAKILPSGDFSFEGLPPGKHRLTLGEHGPNGLQEIAETEITLADQDVTGVVITPFKPAEVRVRVVREGEEDRPLTTGAVFLDPEANRSVWHGLSEFTPKSGVYVFDAVRPGKYEVRFNNVPNCYPKSLESAGRTLDPESIDIAEGAKLDLLLIYSPNVASITGNVEVPQERSPNSVHVFLISQETSAYNHVRFAELDQSFGFSIQNLRPDRYLLFAAEEDDSELWDNAEFVQRLQSDGAEFELQEKQHATAHLRLIPKEQTDRLRQQLGI